MTIMATLQQQSNKFRHSLAVEDAALLVLEAMEGVWNWHKQQYKVQQP